MSKLQRKLISRILKASEEISNKSRKGSGNYIIVNTGQSGTFGSSIMDNIKEERIKKINNILDELKGFKQ